MHQRLTRQESKERTRALLLDAGAQLLRTRPVGDVTGQIRAQEIVRIAGVSTGAFYHHWGSQDEYIDDLLDYVLSAERFEQLADNTMQAVQKVVEEGGSLKDVVTAGTTTNFRDLMSDPYYGLQLALWAAARQDEALLRRMRHLYRERMARYLPFYEQLLAAYGRQMRPEFRVEHLAVVLAALAEGLVIRYAIDEDATRELGAGGNLFAASAFQLVRTMTEPVPDQ